MKIKELELTSGWKVRCRPVPPLAQMGVMDRPDLQYPPPPTVTVKTVAGEETVRAPEGSDESNAYYAACREIDAARDRRGLEFNFAYGVKAWSQDGKKWLKEPPKGWEPEPMLVEAVGGVSNPRTAFIMYELIASAADFRDVNKVIVYTGMDPLTVQEVESAEDGFKSPVEGTAS